jgi:hypothetical protein
MAALRYAGTSERRSRPIEHKYAMKTPIEYLKPSYLID